VNHPSETKGTSVKSTESTSTQPSPTTKPTEVQEGIPVWYEPKIVTLKFLSYKNTSIQPENTRFEDRAIGLSCLQIKRNPDEMGDFLYVKVDEGKIINVNKLIEPIIKKNNTENGSKDFYVLLYSPEMNGAVIAFNSSTNLVIYYVDIGAEKCIKQDKLALKKGYGCNIVADNSFTRFAIRHNGTVLYYDMEKQTVIDITKDSSGKQIYRCDDDTDDVYFSPTGRYIVFSTRDRNGGLSHGLVGCYALYDCKTGNSTIIDGIIDHFTRNDEYAIAEQITGGYKIKCDTMKREELTEENTAVYDRIRITETHTNLPGQMLLTYYDLATAQVKSVTNDPVAAYVFSSDHRYMFYYSKGKRFVTCVNMETQESFTIEVGKSFVDEVESVDKSGTHVARLSLYYDESGKELLLCYYSERVSPQSTPSEKLTLSPRDAINSGINLYYSITSNVCTPNYYQYFNFFEGNGFIYCVVEDGDGLFVVFEDSRDQTLSHYRHKGKTTDSEVEFLGRYPCDTKLNELKKVLSGRKIKVQKAEIDYNKLELAGRDDPLKDIMIVYDPDRYIKCLDNFFIIGFPPDNKSRFESSDFEEIRKILDIALKLPVNRTGYREGLDAKYKIMLHPKPEYRQTLQMDIHIGLYGGKPFLEYGMYQGYISESDYKWITKWCQEWLDSRVFEWE